MHVDMKVKNGDRRRFIRRLAAGVTAISFGHLPGRVNAQRDSVTVLRAVSVWEKPLIWNRPLWELINRVNLKSNGKLRIDWIGGPDAIPPFQGAEAVSKGIFDLVITSPTFVAAAVPEGNAIYLREDLSLRTLYASGIMKALDEIYREKLKVILLGLPGGGIGATFFTRQPPKNLDYFKGRRIRTNPYYTPLLRALGASTVTVAPAEVYSALERGIVDAIGWPLLGVVERKFHEVAKYMLLPSYYDVRLTLLMNQRAHEQLSPDLRRILEDSMHEVEEWGHKLFREESARERTELIKLGVVPVTLTDAESKRFLQIASDAMWEAILKESPNNGVRLKSLFARTEN